MGLTYLEFADEMDRLGVPDSSWDEYPNPAYPMSMYIVKVQGPDGKELAECYPISSHGWTNDSTLGNIARQSVRDAYVYLYGTKASAPPAHKPAPITKADLEQLARECGGTYTEETNYIGRTGKKITFATARDFNGRYTAGDSFDPARDDQRQGVYRQIKKAFEQLPRSNARGGVNDKARVQCKKSQFHGFHPVDERCPLCG